MIDGLNVETLPVSLLGKEICRSGSVEHGMARAWRRQIVRQLDRIIPEANTDGGIEEDAEA